VRPGAPPPKRSDAGVESTAKGAPGGPPQRHDGTHSGERVGRGAEGTKLNVDRREVRSVGITQAGDEKGVADKDIRRLTRGEEVSRVLRRADVLQDRVQGVIGSDERVEGKPEMTHHGREDAATDGLERSLIVLRTTVRSG